MNNCEKCKEVKAEHEMYERACEQIAVQKRLIEKREKNTLERELAESELSIGMTLLETVKKQVPFKPETNKLLVGVGRCKCGAEFLDKDTKYCGNCGQRLDWSE